LGLVGWPSPSKKKKKEKKVVTLLAKVGELLLDHQGF
jgi:hypothetical protein